MTNEEAIIDIRENIQPIIGGKSLDIAISAIEKQIPKTPILNIIYPSGIKSYNCPVCGKGCLVMTDSYCPKYCSNCGQALDWSDIE